MYLNMFMKSDYDAVILISLMFFSIFSCKHSQKNACYLNEGAWLVNGWNVDCFSVVNSLVELLCVLNSSEIKMWVKEKWIKIIIGRKIRFKM